MAWRSHGRTNEDLINNMIKGGIFSSKRVESVMKKVDRANYCPKDPYLDAPQSIGYSVPISAPHVHAIALEFLEEKLKPGNTCLDVGCGSGYLSACMALMVSPKGKAIGIDHIKELADFAKGNIQKDQPSLFENGNVEIIVGDGRQGYLPGAPYDAINVGAAAKELPQSLVDQLKSGGRIVIPIGEDKNNQVLEQIDKLENGKIERKKLINVIYVPLTDQKSQCPWKKCK